MVYTFRPQGVCSQEMQVDVDEQGIIRKLDVLGGCSGNLQGIATLVQGMPAQEAIRRLKGDPLRLQGHLLPGSVRPGTGEGPGTGGPELKAPDASAAKRGRGGLIL